MDYSIVYWSVAILLVLAGLIGLLLPAIPCAPLIFAGLLLAAWAENFTYVGLWTLVVLALLSLLTFGVDLWAAMFGAKKFGASKKAVIGALLGAVVGLFLGLPGAIFCPFIGAVVGELFARKSVDQATRASVGATIGLVIGAALKIAMALMMIEIFVVVRFL